MSIVEVSPRRSRGKVPGLGLGSHARTVLTIAVVAAGLLLLHLTRGTSFWADDWTWITQRRGGGLHNLLAPYNGHLSLVPLAVYRFMFARFGIDSYTPYRTLVIVLSLVVGVLVFIYARRCTTESVAVALTVAMLFEASGWQDTMWAFQVPWLIVCATGITALMLLERRRRVSDAAASALMLLAVCSTSLGLAFAFGIAVDLALTRRRWWRDTWIVAVPLGLYLGWTLHYHGSGIDGGALPSIPVNVAKAGAVALSALTGVSGIAPFQDTGTSLTYGWPLVVLVSAGALWRIRSGFRNPRAISLAAILVVFTASISVVHGELASPLASRYIYVYCLLVVLLAAEFSSGVRPSRLRRGALYVVLFAAVVANFGALRAFGHYIRTSGATTNGALTALQLDRGHVAPETRVHIALYEFLGVSAGSVLSAEHALGSPEYTLPELRRADPEAQTAADGQLQADGDVSLTSRTAVASVSSAGVCAGLDPPAVLPVGGTASVTLAVPPHGLSIAPTLAPATVSVRRFALTFMPLGTIAAGRSAALTIRPDAAPDRWYVQVSSIAPLRACGL